MIMGVCEVRLTRHASAAAAVSFSNPERNMCVLSGANEPGHALNLPLNRVCGEEIGDGRSVSIAVACRVAVVGDGGEFSLVDVEVVTPAVVKGLHGAAVCSALHSLAREGSFRPVCVEELPKVSFVFVVRVI